MKLAHNSHPTLMTICNFLSSTTSLLPPLPPPLLPWWNMKCFARGIWIGDYAVASVGCKAKCSMPFPTMAPKSALTYTNRKQTKQNQGPWPRGVVGNGMPLDAAVGCWDYITERASRICMQRLSEKRSKSKFRAWEILLRSPNRYMIWDSIKFILDKERAQIRIIPSF